MKFNIAFLLSVSCCRLLWPGVVSFSPWHSTCHIRNHNHNNFQSDVSLHAYTIRTNLESLAEERYQQPAYRNVEWLDPSALNNNNDDQEKIDNEDDDSGMILPIYPIPAVYLPIGNHTLNNVEPRNLQMALDLNATAADDDKKDALFCVTLMAADTGKIATTGTLLRAVEIEPTYDPVEPEKLARIRVYCQAEGIVEICSIENPTAASREQRLLRSSEYLRGRVRAKGQPKSDLELQEWKDSILTDYKLLKTMYELGIWGNGEMPPHALTNLAMGLPEDLWQGHGTIWQAAQIWQSLCLTIQSGKQQVLNSDRNELMVEAVCKNGGPLKLPIHMEDLEPSDRRRVQELEIQAQHDFANLQLDPTLDFLALLSLDSVQDQLQWLGEMVSRERRRMERAALEYTSGSIDEDDDGNEIQEQQARKGAWFDDDLW